MQSETETRKYWSTPDTTPALRAELDLSPDGKRVLEIGTAAGHLTRALAQKGCPVVGVDGPTPWGGTSKATAVPRT